MKKPGAMPVSSALAGAWAREGAIPGVSGPADRLSALLGLLWGP
jgi:hypothetical protein